MTLWAIYSQNDYKAHRKNEQHKRLTIGRADVRRTYRGTDAEH